MISNNPKAKGLLYAKKNKIPYKIFRFKNRKIFELKTLKELKKRKIKLICLAGFMKILSKNFIKSFKYKILNIHPSLLPKYAGGMNEDVHGQVLKAGDKETGCTVHLVTERVDEGPILVQKKCPVLAEDTVSSLKERVQKLEGKALVEVIKNWKKGE